MGDIAIMTRLKCHQLHRRENIEMDSLVRKVENHQSGCNKILGGAFHEKTAQAKLIRET